MCTLYRKTIRVQACCNNTKRAFAKVYGCMQHKKVRQNILQLEAIEGLHAKTD